MGVTPESGERTQYDGGQPTTGTEKETQDCCVCDHGLSGRRRSLSLKTDGDEPLEEGTPLDVL